MIAFKGFNKNLTCTMGKGTYQYEIGQTYEEEEANCAQNGFHCVEEPIRVLDWYPNGRWCVVDVQDLHEDGSDKISARKMKIVKEVSLHQLYAHEAAWIMKHPGRQCSQRVKKGTGTAEENDAVIVRGANPKARGRKGSLLLLLRERKGKETEVFAYQVDGEKVKEMKWYGWEGAGNEKE